MNLQVSYTFDAAHRIRGHAGKCAYLHGHTYHLEVTVTAEALDPLGMVMDFDDLGEVVRKAVLDRWDHATLLAAHDPLAPPLVRPRHRRGPGRRPRPGGAARRHPDGRGPDPGSVEGHRAGAAGPREP